MLAEGGIIRPAFRRYTGQTLAKFMVTLFTGIITGIFAVMMSKSVANLFAFKNDFIQEIIDDDGANGVLLAYLWHLAYSIALVTLAVAMVGLQTLCLGSGHLVPRCHVLGWKTALWH